MKWLFATTGVVLLIAYAALVGSYPQHNSKVPLLYWATDPAPSREGQIAGFYAWLKEHGHVTADGTPVVRIKVDANNSTQDKIIIQGVSGLASDLIDCRGGGQARMYHRIGILRDVTQAARRGGFSPDQTWPAVRSEIVLHGRQYTFPCNVAVRQYWVNKDAFARVHMKAPPRQWSFARFEAMGKRFVQRSNKPGDRQRVFFADDIPLQLMFRSLGLSIYNQTLTACDLNDPRYVRVLKLKHRWVYQDHLIPTPSQNQSMQGQAGWGGAGPQMFLKGRIALFYSGRYMVMQFRKMVEPRLGVAGVPDGGYPNALTTTRAAGVYVGSDHPELAMLFQQYLASERYNKLIIEDGDALPPNPKYATGERFLNPPRYPREAGCAGVFAEVERTIAIAEAPSEFILQPVAQRIMTQWQEKYDNGLVSAKEAARGTAQEIDARIYQVVRHTSELQPLYQQRVALQKKINQRLAAGQKLPTQWIANPFYRRYYANHHMLIGAGKEKNASRMQQHNTYEKGDTP